MRKAPLILIWFLSLVAVASPLRAAVPPASLKVVSEGRGALHGGDPTVQFVVHSQRAGRDFLIQVTPSRSPPWLPGQKAPAVYVLDGGYGVFAPSALFVSGSSAILPAYIVTIQYPPGRPGEREKDMLFQSAIRPDGSRADGGGAEIFAAFLLEELRPFIEARYPVDPANAILVGHSLAGVFTANLLVREPGAFSGYLIASPSVWADPGVVDRLAHRPAALAPPRRVFVAYGGAEASYMVSGGHQLARAISRNPSAFTGAAHVFRGADHLSYYPELAREGLGFLLPRTPPIRYPEAIKTSVEALRRYAGVYELSDGRRVNISLEGDHLTAVLAYPGELWKVSGRGRFFIDGPNAWLTFEGPRSGAPKLLRIELNGDEAVARRLPK